MASDYSKGYDEGYENGVESMSPLVRELAAALKDAERYETDDGRFCPWCGYKEWAGHREGCHVGIALAHAKERGFE